MQNLRIVRFTRILAGALFGISLLFINNAPAFSQETEEAPQTEVDSDDSEVDALPEESSSLRLRPYSSPRLRAILERGVLRVGMAAVYPPFRIDSGPGTTGDVAPTDARVIGPEEYPGIDVELANDLARALGVRLEIRTARIEGLMRMVQDNEVDLALAGVSSTLERARYIQFADPYLITTPAVLLSKARLPNESQSVDFPRRQLRGIADLQRLDSMTLGVIKGTTTEALLDDDPAFSKHKIERFTRRTELIEAFEKNRIDAIVADAVFITALTLQKPEYLVNSVALVQMYREEHLSPGFAYGDPGYADFLNFFVKELRRTGRLDALQRKYLESDAWVP